MRILTIALRVFLFAVLLLFCVRNLDPVTLRFYFGIEWSAPLALILFAFFAAGVVIGALSLLPRLVRAHRRPATPAERGVAR
ncbi:MAG: lipopolysaccharide assembly LapA domain-containing protein [Burkholderiales bacterium]